MLKTYFIDLFHNMAKKCPERTKWSSIVIAVLCEDALDKSSSVAGLNINRWYFFLFPSVMIFALKSEADDLVNLPYM